MDTTSNQHCFVCNSRVGVSTRNAIQIFSEQVQTYGERPLQTAVSCILGLDIKPNNIHSVLLCKKCFKSINEYDELETRMSEIRDQLISNYNRTIIKYNGEPIHVEHEVEMLDESSDFDDGDSEFVTVNFPEENDQDVEKEQIDNNNVDHTDPNLDEGEQEMTIEFEIERMHQEDSNSQSPIINNTTKDTANKQNNRIGGIIHKIDAKANNRTGRHINLKKQNENADDNFAISNENEDPIILETFGIDNDLDQQLVEIVAEGTVECDDVIEEEEEEYEDEEHIDLNVSGDHQLDVNTAALLEAAALAEQTDAGNMLQVVNIKLEPEDEYTKQTTFKRKRHPTRKIKQEVEYSEPIINRNGSVYTCLLCTNETKESSNDIEEYDAKNIVIHMKSTHDQRIYVCDVCGAHFRKRNEMSEHLDDHVAAEEGDFQCEVCNRIFNNLRLFRIHKRMHYPQNKMWHCETCGKKYSSRNLLDEHTNTHTGNRPYHCKHCSKDFASKYTMSAHLKTHTERPRPFVCNQCGKAFFSQQNLTQHVRTHSGVKNFVCKTCGKRFGTTHNLEVHNIVHTGKKPFICRTCGKAFARKAEIRDHERTHTGERPYACEICGAQFSQRSNLQSHKRATHFDDKRHKCDLCGKCFKRRRLLDYHIKASHTGERPFKCTTCDATFVYPEHFKKHKRIHSGEKPYLCEVCGKAFNSRDNRNAHRFVHSDKKPYECLLCGQGFMRKPLLYAHMQSQGHLNETFVVNQPRLQTDDHQIITMERIGEENELAAASIQEVGAKLYLNDLREHVLIQGDNGEIYAEEATDKDFEDIQRVSDEDMSEEHLIIDGQVHFTEETNENEQIDEIELDEDDQVYEEEYFQIVSEDAADTHIEIVPNQHKTIKTADGPLELVQIKLPGDDENEGGFAWVNIVRHENAM